MESIGAVARLQVQRASLKPGVRGQRWYDPAPLYAVQAVTLSPGGVTCRDERAGSLVDVHHRDHPSSKYSVVNGVSIGFSAHYDAMRARFGDHLTDGIAGENILVRTARPIAEEELRAGLSILTASGERVQLERFLIAEPCVEFTRYALCYPPDARSDATVAAALAFLRNGMRGFYASYAGPRVTVQVGDAVYL